MGASHSQKLKPVFLFLVASFLIATVQGAELSAGSSRYIFIPDQSTVVQTGGFAGVHWTYAIEGQFCLIVDTEADTARFEQVDANAVDTSEPSRTLAPDDAFNLIGLAGAVIDEMTIEFTGKAANETDVRLTLTFEDDTVHLLGETIPPPNSADFFILNLDATAQRKYAGGTGEPNHPYQIATPEQMNQIGLHEEDWDKHFQLTADIDLVTYQGTEFNIIARDVNMPFRGVFDGSGHTISNFRYEVQGADDVGLFGIVADPNARIENLTLVTSSIEIGWGQHTGLLVADLREGTLINCHARNATVRGMWFVGGLAGQSGYMEPHPGTLRTSATIVNCSYEGSVHGGFTMIGGLVGKNYRSAIYHCFTTGEVFGQCDTGGLIGSATDSRIISCYSTCAVTGSNGAGGLVGDSFSGSITQCYATGPLGGDNDVGGLLWDIFGDSTTVRASFWDIETSGQTTSSGGVGKTTVEMHNPQTFIDAGWDFIDQADGPSDIWAEPEDGGYPILWWQLSELPEMPFAGGTGSESDPYLIATAAQLNSIGYNPRLMDAHFRMIDDIDLEGVSVHLIGSEDYPYGGVFDGGGFTISNFSHIAKQSGPVGLFRVIDGTGCGAEVRDLGLVVPDIHGDTTYCVGSLVGRLGKGTLRNCYVEGGCIVGEADVGGLVGQNGSWDARRGSRSGRIIDCHSNTMVTGRDFVGGLAGTNSRDGTVANCHASGTVTGMQGIAGLVGCNSSATIADCYSLGTVSAQWSAGGLVGTNSEGTVRNCFSNAVVTGDYYLGGLVGTNWGMLLGCYAVGEVSGDEIVGGLVGRNGSKSVWREDPGVIYNSYASAVVTGDAFIGGLVGYHELGAIVSCFWDIEASGENTSLAGMGLTTAQMQTADTFLEAGWDFVGEDENGAEEIWWIDEGRDYPRLWWETIEEIKE